MTSRLKALLVFFIILSAVPCLSEASERKETFVKYVIDGDTITVPGGESVRYIGIDTPERGEPFYMEARQRNLSLVKGRKITLVFCDNERRDKYGRLLAWVYAGGVFVNEVLLKEGLARRLPIPPCGTMFSDEFKAAEKAARDKRLGIWADKAVPGSEMRVPLR